MNYQRASKSRTHIRGLFYILSNPYLFRRLIVRELFHRRRFYGKREWIKWQIYDALTSMPHHGSLQSLSQPLNKARIETIIHMVQNIGQNLRILDVGCGDGSIGKTLRRIGHDVMSLELPKVASLAKNDYNVRDIVAGDAEIMPFKSESFDVVIAAEIFEHLWNPKSFFKESHRILRCGGYLILSSLEGPEALRYDTHKQYVTIEALKDGLKGIFKLSELIHLEPQGAAPTYTIVAMLRRV
ncbi:MAG: class I SAM-dependent methyltransferase [Candidatus Bathyarchaeia archaeon]